MRTARPLFLLAVLLFCASCAASKSPAPEVMSDMKAEGSSSLSGQLSFFVADSMMDGQGMLEGVEVRMITKRGEIVPVGKTNPSGVIAVEKSLLEKGVFLIFSLEGFFNGAWEIKPATVRRAQERYLKLARFAVR